VFLPANIEPPDVVFHLAGQASAYVARKNPALDASVNVIGLLNLLEAIRALPAAPFVVHVGAATEVGLTTSTIGDNLPDNPMTFYDVGKVAQRLYLQQYEREGWIDTVTLQLANVYGNPRIDAASDRGFLNNSMRAALRGQTLTYFNDAAYIRDFIHIDDVVTALVAATKNRSSTRGEHYLIGTGVGTSIREALQMIADEVEGSSALPVLVKAVAPPVGLYAIERREVAIDSTRFTVSTGWQSTIDLRTGIRRTLNLVD